MRTDRAEAVIRSLPRAGYRRYANLFPSILPITPTDYFRRWLFAYASIKTDWRRNVTVYNRIKDLAWLWDENELRYRLEESGGGMHNTKAASIMQFARHYWSDPTAYYGREGETWAQFRTRLAVMTLGIGLAKSSFVIEMTWPKTAEVVCLDVHMFRLYAVEVKSEMLACYEQVEAHWVDTCLQTGWPPVIARWLFWDAKQGYPDCQYWSDCLRKGF